MPDGRPQVSDRADEQVEAELEVGVMIPARVRRLVRLLLPRYRGGHADLAQQ